MTNLIFSIIQYFNDNHLVANLRSEGYLTLTIIFIIFCLSVIVSNLIAYLLTLILIIYRRLI